MMVALGEMVILALVQQCAPSVAPSTLSAIIAHESKGNPYAIGINTSGYSLRRQPNTADEAAQTARELLAKGINFDAGLGQINSANFRRLGLTPETVFQPCRNIKAAAHILTENYKSARDAGWKRPLDAAISAYNTGSMTKGFRNGYVGKVYQQAGYSTANVSGAKHSVATVSALLQRAFDARITDALRPMDAAYGAERSYHKFAQAVDFVPAAGLHSITKAQIRRVLESEGVTILELLGPGDRGHSDHFHVAFATGSRSNPVRIDAPMILASNFVQGGGGAEHDGEASTPVMVSEIVEDDPAPPSWDVFAVRKWQLRKASQ